MADKKLRVFKLRAKEVDDLRKELDKHKEELASLRVNKVAGGTAPKMAKIKVVRKTIAKYKTVIHQKKLAELKKKLENSKHKPLNLRGKRTRALRQRLTKYERNQRTVRQIKKQQNFPLRKFALRA